MSQQQPSGWNNYFHKDQGYDTTYNNNNTQAMQEPTSLSFFPRKQEQEYNNNGETREVISDVEKVGHNNPGDPSFWKSPGSEHSPEGRGEVVIPSAPPESPRGNVTFERERGLESDEELARRLYREEQEQYMRYSQGSMKPPGGGIGYQRPGEADNYYAAVGNGGDRRDSSNVQVGMGAQLPTEPAGPRLQKAYSDPLLIPKKKSWKRPYFTYIVTLIQLALLIYEFIYNKQQTGSLIQINPFNPLIGPSASPTLIQLGARFVPCMKLVPSLDNNTPILCSNDPTKGTCTIEQICGFGGFKGDKPNQWFRFITPIFLHGGVVHFLLNMIFQVQTGKQIEIEIGWMRYSLIYMASGIFGFIFGGNFSDTTTPSVGASGSLFGLVGVLFLDLFQNWKLIRNPYCELTKMVIMIIITFAIGLLPAIDNFSHIGGFVMGIVMGLMLIPTKNHKKLTWILRIVAIPIAALLFFLLIRNFYVEDPTKTCTWCKYLDCLPVSDWCDTTGLKKCYRH
ncbi:13378_t:CDS:1 [Funneliformis mosseae]|uniref:Rhomboid-type serine protease n=1 Tax=Funneliformis mosseae TaxID=27381 RepID=A0A9N8ZQI3_FUNMO|nr:13378_t:CDS:1 [Funneliformis mosseae]